MAVTSKREIAFIERDLERLAGIRPEVEAIVVANDE
jgi:hypothetical protein